MRSITNSQRNANQNYNEVFHTSQNANRQTIYKINAAEGMEKTEHYYTVGVNLKASAENSVEDPCKLKRE